MLKAPTKITFKHSTKMTLNARFTSIMKSRPPTTSQTVTAQVSTKNLASEKNRRLAQQMESRTAVGAALTSVQPSTSTPRLSVHDRLGTGGIRGRGRTLPSNTQARLQNNNLFRGLSTNKNRARGLLRGALRRGTNQTRGVSSRGRGFRSSQRGRGGTGRGSKGFVPSVGKSFRGGVYKRGYRGRGRGRGGRGRGGKPGGKGKPVDKGALDNDLDSYMCKTKGSMDAELDAYMANLGGN